MNVFDKVLNLLGIAIDNQSYSHIYLLLKVCSDYETAHPTADTNLNPWVEVLYRLRAHNATYAYRQIEELFGTRVDKSVSPWQAQSA